MKKEIKDYLHLYLPVSVELNNGGSKVYNRIAVACGNMDDEFRYVTLRIGTGAKSFTHSILFSEKDRVKPILRPLSDMTEEEAFQLEDFMWQSLPDAMTNDRSEILKMFDNRFPNYRPAFSIYVRAANWMRKNSFDCDGLIESGLAIDKSLLNKVDAVQECDARNDDQGTNVGNIKAGNQIKNK